MTFVETIPEGDATGELAELYDADRAALGHVPNYAKAFSLRPGVYAAWRRLSAEVRSGMDARRYELATVAAARRIRSSYCTLAHGSALRRARPRAPRRADRRAPDRRRLIATSPRSAASRT
jgi:AhpD family alkylhydroperoxidase